MGADLARNEPPEKDLRSPLTWAVLGLVVEVDRPSYGYDLINRYESRFGSLSSSTRIYASLHALAKRSWIRELTDPDETQKERRNYVGTPSGRERYREWMVNQLREDYQRSQAFLRQLVGVLVREPDAALDVIEHYRHVCLETAAEVSIPRPDGTGSLQAARLHAEASRLDIGARLAWLEYATQQFRTPQ